MLYDNYETITNYLHFAKKQTQPIWFSSHEEIRM